MSDERPAQVLPQAASTAFILKGQSVHLAALVLLLPVAWALAAPKLGDGSWGFSDTTWFVFCLVVAVLHQLLVLVGWRGQLAHQMWTARFADQDFAMWKKAFLPPLIARPLLVLALGLADKGSLEMNAQLSLFLGCSLLIPAGYTFWSVHRHFGIDRASGGDHFRQRYRELPLVDQGAFAWTPNAMYTLGFLALWAVALLFQSHAALVAALFQHAYIQVHFVCTEKPDMDLIYGGAGEGSGRDAAPGAEPPAPEPAGEE